jgi:hypothetical protein
MKIAREDLKHPLRFFLRHYRFKRALQHLAFLPVGKVPNRELLNDLSLGWNNLAYSADLDYLQRVGAEAIGTKGNVLECGSGVTTFILAALLGRRGREVHSLEHDPSWHKRVVNGLRRMGATNVHVHLSPLRNYGNFHWYAPPLDRLPGLFSLIVCDGPPEATPGGRFGLFPVMQTRLNSQTLILVDDAESDIGSGVLARWKNEWGVKVEIVSGASGGLARVTSKRFTTSRA